MKIQNKAHAKKVLGDCSGQMHATASISTSRIYALARQGQRIIEETVNANSGQAEDILDKL